MAASDDMNPGSATTPTDPGGHGRTALLLMGGGARAAYAVGFLRCLARRLPQDSDFDVLAGVSAGAINAAYLASRPGSLQERVEGLAELWLDLEPASVMDIGTGDLLRNVALWSLQLMGGGADFLPTARGLVDCRPLRRLLERTLPGEGNRIDGIEERIAGGGLASLLVTTTSYATGEAVVWSQGRPVPGRWTREGRRSEQASLTVDHIMASAALPLFFPAVRLGEEWHGDGDIRLTSPLSPLVAMGVDRIVAVSTHSGPDPGRQERITAYPTPGQVAGTVLNTSVLHHLEADARKLRRVNDLLELGGLERTPDGADERWRRVELVILRPSRDLEALAGELESDLPWALRHMIRGLGTHATESPGLLSMISFQPDYLAALVEAGEKDAEARAEELEAFLTRPT